MWKFTRGYRFFCYLRGIRAFTIFCVNKTIIHWPEKFGYFGTVTSYWPIIPGFDCQSQCYPGYVPSSPMKVGTILYHTISSGWWCNNPSEKYDFVTWDDDIPNRMESHKSHVPVTTNQSYIWVNYHISLPRISCQHHFGMIPLTKYDNLIQFTQIPSGKLT